MKSTVQTMRIKSPAATVVPALLLAFLLSLSTGRATADYLSWVGNDSSDWNTEGTAGTLASENWNDLNYGPNGPRCRSTTTSPSSIKPHRT